MAINKQTNQGSTKTVKADSRREFISKSLGGIAFLGATGAGVLSGSLDQNMPAKVGDKLKIIVAGGHPGDPEYGCGGTIARYTDLGHEVVLLYLNRGEGGIEGKTGPEAGRIRTAEALQACEILKARAVFASQTDGQSVVDASHYKEFADILAKEQPDIVFTQWPVDNHPDHRAISSLVYYAWQKLRESRSSVKPVLYFYEVSNGEDTLMFSPNTYADITAFESRKQKACLAHASQAPEKFYPLQEQVSRFRGLECGCKTAESFILHVWSARDLFTAAH